MRRNVGSVVETKREEVPVTELSVPYMVLSRRAASHVRTTIRFSVDGSHNTG